MTEEEEKQRQRLRGFWLGCGIGLFSGLGNPGGKGQLGEKGQDHGLCLGHAEFGMPVRYPSGNTCRNLEKLAGAWERKSGRWCEFWISTDTK